MGLTINLGQLSKAIDASLLPGATIRILIVAEDGTVTPLATGQEGQYLQIVAGEPAFADLIETEVITYGTF